MLEMQELSNRVPGKLVPVVGKATQHITTATALASVLQPRSSHSYPAISIYTPFAKLDAWIAKSSSSLKTRLPIR